MIDTDTGETLDDETAMRKIGMGEVIDFIKEAHGDQKRINGTPYYLHPVAVMAILYEWMQDMDSYPMMESTNKDIKFRRKTLEVKMLQAAGSHDLLEDTKVTEEEMINKFGTVVTSWVKYVTKPKKLQGKIYGSEYKTTRSLKAYSGLAVAPIFVKWLKLADRYHNLSEMKDASMEFRENYLIDTQMLLSIINLPHTIYPMKKVVFKYWIECQNYYADLQKIKGIKM